MSEILCKKCGKPLEELDRGRYYAHICKDCCEKHGLCPDCGHSVIITIEQAKAGFACSGWHSVECPKLEGDVNITPVSQIESDFSWIGPPYLSADFFKKKVECPKCGHKFEVSQ